MSERTDDEVPAKSDAPAADAETREQPEGEVAPDTADAAGADEAYGTDEAEETEETEDEPRITLDRYLSKRRPPVRGGITHLVGAVLMLVTLILIMIYKDRCGQMVSGLMGEMKSPSKESIPAKIEVQGQEKGE